MVVAAQHPKRRNPGHPFTDLARNELEDIHPRHHDTSDGLVHQILLLQKDESHRPILRIIFIEEDRCHLVHLRLAVGIATCPHHRLLVVVIVVENRNLFHRLHHPDIGMVAAILLFLLGNINTNINTSSFFSFNKCDVFL